MLCIEAQYCSINSYNLIKWRVLSLNIVPDNIKFPNSLQELYLGFNSLSELPNNVYELSSLKKLEVQNNQISEYTYGDIYKKVSNVAANLKQLGLNKGDHIAVISENRPEWAISYFAIYVSKLGVS